MPLCAEAGRSGVSICIGCTGGHHRSVAVSVELGKRLTENGYHTVVHHRDMRQE
ncbi:MAG: hypothetical protein J6P31_03880 [Oscillospiraceae bacterium]|nr:hypothetical protein [Oscillospiraceae bacterium]